MPAFRVLAAAVAMAAVLAGCASRTPPPVSEPAPVSQPPPAPPPPPPPVDWRDAPLSPGDWDYGHRPGPRAAFGAEGPLFVVECTPARQIHVARLGIASGATLIVRTTFGERSLPASGDASTTAATLARGDPLLDEIAFSRGRVLVRVSGQPDLIVPSWPELARVVEDCRG
jgi:hypothetical protein